MGHRRVRRAKSASPEAREEGREFEVKRYAYTPQVVVDGRDQPRWSKLPLMPEIGV